jgi:hypothetical protein
MFNNKKTDEITSLKNQLKEEESSHRLALMSKEKEHELTLKEKEFELKHFKDEEVKKLQNELNEQKQTNAVLKKENEMLDKITNLNADIIDIKDLVSNLINKLPEIKLNNLTISNERSDK